MTEKKETAVVVVKKLTLCEAEITDDMASIALDIWEQHIENSITFVMVLVWLGSKELLIIQKTTFKLLTDASLQEIAIYGNMEEQKSST